MDNKLAIDIWSDVACPWCYVGKRRLEAALEKFPQRDSVEITWHAFELDPSAPKSQPPGVSYAGRLAKKYGKTIAEGEQMLAQMTRTAAVDGLDFHFEKAQAGNTFDAHRLIHLAASRGLQGKMKERLLRAYFSEGEQMSDVETLIRLGAEVGLDREEVRAMLASDAGTKEVREDEAQAHELGISGVPFFVVGRRYGVSGAQPAEVLLEVLNKVWSERAPVVAEGAVCGPDGC